MFQPIKFLSRSVAIRDNSRRKLSELAHFSAITDTIDGKRIRSLQGGGTEKIKAQHRAVFYLYTNI